MDSEVLFVEATEPEGAEVEIPKVVVDFFEEGFAEFVALRVDPSLAGFPWFDFSVTIVAGQWVAESQDIPLSTLRERHQELNLPCRVQSYALRSPFFDWLGRTHGDEVVVQASRARTAGALTDYEKFFGLPFDHLGGIGERHC